MLWELLRPPGPTDELTAKSSIVSHLLEKPEKSDPRVDARNTTKMLVFQAFWLRHPRRPRSPIGHRPPPIGKRGPGARRSSQPLAERRPRKRSPHLPSPPPVPAFPNPRPPRCNALCRWHFHRGENPFCAILATAAAIVEDVRRPRTANGKRQTANGKRQTANGKLQTAYS